MSDLKNEIKSIYSTPQSVKLGSGGIGRQSGAESHLYSLSLFVGWKRRQAENFELERHKLLKKTKKKKNIGQEHLMAWWIQRTS